MTRLRGLLRDDGVRLRGQRRQKREDLLEEDGLLETRRQRGDLLDRVLPHLHVVVFEQRQVRLQQQLAELLRLQDRRDGAHFQRGGLAEFVGTRAQVAAEDVQHLRAIRLLGHALQQLLREAHQRQLGRVLRFRGVLRRKRRRPRRTRRTARRRRR